jgi:hypothetical protein
MWRNRLGGSRDIYTSTSTDGGKTFGDATKLGSGTWKINGCPMDGGSIAGSYSVWRRESAVYFTDGKSSEHILGDGKQPVVAIGKPGPYFIWQQGAQLMLKTMNTAPIIFSRSGAYPAMAVTPVKQTPIVVWESNLDGVKTIFSEVLK